MKDELTNEAYVALSKYRQERAHETLEEIPFLREKGYYGTAINRLYYACYYAALALLAKHHISSGSLSQDLTPKQAKMVTNSVKNDFKCLNTACSVYNLKDKGTDKAIGVLNTILSGISTTSNTKNTVEDAKKKD